MAKAKPIKAWAIVSKDKISVNDNGPVRAMLIFYKRQEAYAMVWKESEHVVEVSITRHNRKDATDAQT